MTERQRKKFNTGILIGLAIIIAGAIMLLENLDMGFGIHALDYWPVILILIGIGKILDCRRPKCIYWGVIFIGIGILFQLNNLGIINFWFDDLWPILIILAGIAIIQGTFRKPGCCGSGRYHHHHWRHGSGDGHSWDGPFHSRKDTLNDEFITISTVLSGAEYKIINKKFKGGQIDSVLSGCELDFTSAEMDGSRAELAVSAVLGSVEMRVPSNWEVVIDGSPVMGSIENKTTPPIEMGKKLVIKGSSVMGSIEVRN
jgi:hypothetical protein